MKKFNESPIIIESPFEPGKIISITCHTFIDESYKVHEYFRISDLSDITNIDPHTLRVYKDEEHNDFIEPINLIKCFYYSRYAINTLPFSDNSKPIINEQQFKDFALKLVESSINVHWYQQSMAYSTYIHDLSLADDKKSFDDCFN